MTGNVVQDQQEEETTSFEFEVFKVQFKKHLGGLASNFKLEFVSAETGYREIFRIICQSKEANELIRRAEKVEEAEKWDSPEPVDVMTIYESGVFGDGKGISCILLYSNQAREFFKYIKKARRHEKKVIRGKLLETETVRPL